MNYHLIQLTIFTHSFLHTFWHFFAFHICNPSWTDYIFLVFFCPYLYAFYFVVPTVQTPNSFSLLWFTPMNSIKSYLRSWNLQFFWHFCSVISPINELSNCCRCQEQSLNWDLRRTLRNFLSSAGKCENLWREQHQSERTRRNWVKGPKC